MRSIFAGLVSFIAIFAAATVRAETPAALAPRDGVLLLKNGEALNGRITHAGDQYYVSLKFGVIQVKATEVEMSAESLAEIYERKRAKLKPGIEGHLELADWCMREHLLDSAAKEVDEAKAIDARHPRLVYLQRRLVVARQPAAAQPAHVAAVTGPTNDELDRFIRGMPEHTVETFTSTIQPLLMNNCATAGCHGPRSSGKLRLTRLPLNGPVGRRLTQRNLHSVWQTINHADFAASPLLTQPVERHGTAKAAIFTSREGAQYRQLLGWVREATRRKKPGQPATVGTPVRHLAQAKPTEAPSASASAPADPSAEPPIEAEADGPEAKIAALDATDGDPTVAEPEGPAEKAPGREREKAYQAVDPFDAEVFNRRYFARPAPD